MCTSSCTQLTHRVCVYIRSRWCVSISAVVGVCVYPQIRVVICIRVRLCVGCIMYLCQRAVSVWASTVEERGGEEIFCHIHVYKCTPYLCTRTCACVHVHVHSIFVYTYMYTANVHCVCGYLQSEEGGGEVGPEETVNWECDLSDRLARLHERLTRLRHENSMWTEGSRSRRSIGKGRFSGEGGSPNKSVSVCCSVLQCRARGCVCNGAAAIGRFVGWVPPLTAR